MNIPKSGGPVEKCIWRNSGSAEDLNGQVDGQIQQIADELENALSEIM